MLDIDLYNNKRLEIDLSLDVLLLNNTIKQLNFLTRHFNIKARLSRVNS